MDTNNEIIGKSHQGSINDTNKVTLDIQEILKNDPTKKFIRTEENYENSNVLAINDSSRSEIEPQSQKKSAWDSLSLINKISCAGTTFCMSFIACIMIYSILIKN